jgi:hypothetical protein
MNFHALFHQLVRKRSGRFIITSHAQATVPEPARNGAHANAPDTEEIHTMVVTELHRSIFLIR